MCQEDWKLYHIRQSLRHAKSFPHFLSLLILTCIHTPNIQVSYKVINIMGDKIMYLMSIKDNDILRPLVDRSQQRSTIRNQHYQLHLDGV